LNPFAGIGQGVAICTVNEIAVGKRLIRLTGVLKDDAGLIGDFLIGTLEKVG
jgi:hypothetical protein